ncbi:hypothetical protein HK107_11245 [Parvularcula sp. ZS-1/3]|uniref:DoxX family membrane protein n=1 Tax=Parvularcula mediterranea TaxID=2732508 RepID=A0A7Y3RMN9_9PROT|nr:hypothetical protein [Parvularcula mediterranea]NNU16893.1 hypothetical protein [Parvularcula mediterranea]
MRNVGIFLACALIAFWMLGGGVVHFVSPEAFFPIVPDWLPELEVVLISGAVEIAIGLGVIVRRTRALAGLAFAALCAGFLPLHLWDFFRPDPVFEVPVAASIRIGVQFALIAIGLWLWKASGR